MIDGLPPRSAFAAAQGAAIDLDFPMLAGCLALLAWAW